MVSGGKFLKERKGCHDVFNRGRDEGMEERDSMKVL